MPRRYHRQQLRQGAPIPRSWCRPLPPVMPPTKPNGSKVCSPASISAPPCRWSSRPGRGSQPIGPARRLRCSIIVSPSTGSIVPDMSSALGQGAGPHARATQAPPGPISLHQVPAGCAEPACRFPCCGKNGRMTWIFRPSKPTPPPSGRWSHEVDHHGIGQLTARHDRTILYFSPENSESP